MIIIPPSSEHEEYFNGLAKNIWNNSIEDKSRICDELLSENKTLVISCNVDLEDSREVTFHLHFRYFKTILYCFIEED
jgi:hypothetical protein